jgi:hypothetical protein
MMGRARAAGAAARPRVAARQSAGQTISSSTLAARRACASYGARAVGTPPHQQQQHRAFSSAADDAEASSLLAPTEIHGMLREAARTFAEEQVDPQGLEHDKHERFNMELFRQVGEQGYLGVTVPEEYGGQGLDATASVIIHEELAAADPGFCLSYLAHSLLFCNNLAVNGSPEQCMKYLPRDHRWDVHVGAWRRHRRPRAVDDRPERWR